MQDEKGDVVCPILSAYKCKLCGATGTKAHTIKYCKMNFMTKGDPIKMGLPSGLAPKSYDLMEHLPNFYLPDLQKDQSKTTARNCKSKQFLKERKPLPPYVNSRLESLPHEDSEEALAICDDFATYWAHEILSKFGEGDSKCDYKHRRTSKENAW